MTLLPGFPVFKVNQIQYFPDELSKFQINCRPVYFDLFPDNLLSSHYARVNIIFENEVGNFPS